MKDPGTWDRWRLPQVARLSLAIDAGLAAAGSGLLEDSGRPKLGPVLCALSLSMGQAVLQWARTPENVDAALDTWTAALRDAVAFLRSEVHGDGA